MDKDNQPLAGIRMQIPERLLGAYKDFEQYGHAMWNKHGKGFKRHIKLNDSQLNLYMDAFIPRAKKWVRIDIEMAREDNRKRRDSKATDVDKALLQTHDEEAKATEEMETAD